MQAASICAIFLAVTVSSVVQAQAARVAVASNFLPTAETIAAAYRRDSGHEIALSAGSSGKLYAQIINGAPFDLFLSADAARPQRLEEDGIAAPGTRFTYARGRLVLWSAAARYRGQDCRQQMADGRFGKVAIANPATAPYGTAAVEVMAALGQPLERLAGRVVLGENIAQTLQFAAAGGADFALTALALSRTAAVGGTTCRWAIPETLHTPILQQAVLLERAKGNSAATGFFRYLKSDPALEVIRAHGYGVGS